MEPVDAQQLGAGWMQSLAEATRLAIIRILSDGPKNVSDIAESLNVEMVNVSHHLGRMKSAGILDSMKKGRFVVYSLPRDTLVNKNHVCLKHPSGIIITLPRLTPEEHSRCG